jgi:hypothetical protein
MEYVPMIARLKKSLSDKQKELESDRFLAMLPRIRRQASLAFRHLRAEAREEMVQEVTANAYQAWVRLVSRGREHVARPTPLTRFAIRQVLDGRRVGCRQNLQDIMSLCVRRNQDFKIERLDQRDRQTEGWNELLVEDRRAGPAETAAARIDFADWLRTLSRRNQQIARALAREESTGGVARRFDLSPGRVSQLRVWLREHWEQFQRDSHLVGYAA